MVARLSPKRAAARARDADLKRVQADVLLAARARDAKVGKAVANVLEAARALGVSALSPDILNGMDVSMNTARAMRLAAVALVEAERGDEAQAPAVRASKLRVSWGVVHTPGGDDAIVSIGDDAGRASALSDTLFECRTCARTCRGRTDGAFYEPGWGRIEGVGGPNAICPSCQIDPRALDGLVRDGYPNARYGLGLCVEPPEARR